eukprot:3673288-Pyramimonas_sp.AAC.1
MAGCPPCHSADLARGALGIGASRDRPVASSGADAASRELERGRAESTPEVPMPCIPFPDSACTARAASGGCRASLSGCARVSAPSNQ